MTPFTIDFRSDMLGRRSPAAISAFAAAASDPPSMDEGDRHKRALEEAASDLLGFDEALFLPTCTMANQIAVRYLTDNGASIIAEGTTHLVMRESNAATRLHGASIVTFDASDGHPTAGQLSRALGRIEESKSRDALCSFWIEESHNAAGGTVMPEGRLQRYTELCGQRACWLHMDGARIWNASVASGKALRDHTAGVDSLAVSLNKCLGAPLGGLLLGSRSFIAWARSLRTDLGGFWRPVGALAAASLAALRDYREQVIAVHKNALRFHGMLANDCPEIVGTPPQTNIVMLALGDDGRANCFVERIGQSGIGALAYGGGRVRFVLHSGIADDQMETAVVRIRAAVDAI